MPAPALAAAGQLQGAALPGRPIEVVAVRRDALGRVVLQGAGLTLHVATPVELPLGARLMLALPAARALPGSIPGSAAADDRPLEAVRLLAEALPEAAEEQGAAATPRLPGPTAALAARLLRLVQTLGSPPESGAGPGTADTGEPQGASARIGGALAELGRLASEPQNGWRLFLLPSASRARPRSGSTCVTTNPSRRAARAGSASARRTPGGRSSSSSSATSAAARWTRSVRNGASI